MQRAVWGEQVCNPLAMSESWGKGRKRDLPPNLLTRLKAQFSPEVAQGPPAGSKPPSCTLMGLQSVLVSHSWAQGGELPPRKLIPKEKQGWIQGKSALSAAMGI